VEDGARRGVQRTEDCFAYYTKEAGEKGLVEERESEEDSSPKDGDTRCPPIQGNTVLEAMKRAERQVCTIITVQTVRRELANPVDTPTSRQPSARQPARRRGMLGAPHLAARRELATPVDTPTDGGRVAQLERENASLRRELEARVLPGTSEDEVGCRAALLKTERGTRHRRPPSDSTRNSKCPVEGCTHASRRMRRHILGCHLPPCLRELGRGARAREERNRNRASALRWLTNAILGPVAQVSDLVPLFNEHNHLPVDCTIPEQSTEGLKELCRREGWRTPEAFLLSPVNSPAALIYWRVAALLLNEIPDWERAAFQRVGTP